MKSKKFMAIPIFLIIALVLMGFAYAHWEKIVTINGKVTTGEVCWEFEEGSIIQRDPYDPPTKDSTCDPGFTNPRWLDKNVGYTNVTVLDQDGDGCNEILDVKMVNVYPCYYEHIAFWVHNCGSIPIKIWKVIIGGQAFYALPIYMQLDLNNDGKADIEIKWGDNFGVQIEPCQTITDISFDVHVLQPAPPDTTLHFTIEFVAINWNEYAAGPVDGC